jgi:hypothetical protein
VLRKSLLAPDLVKVADFSCFVHLFQPGQAPLVAFSLFFRVGLAQVEVPHQCFMFLGLSSSIFAHGVCGLLQKLVPVYF